MQCYSTEYQAQGKSRNNGLHHIFDDLEDNFYNRRKCTKIANSAPKHHTPITTLATAENAPQPTEIESKDTTISMTQPSTSATAEPADKPADIVVTTQKNLPLSTPSLSFP